MRILRSLALSRFTVESFLTRDSVHSVIIVHREKSPSLEAAEDSHFSGNSS